MAQADTWQGQVGPQEVARPRPRSAPPNEYAELKRLIQEKGLLDKQLTYYASRILFVLALLAVGITVLIVVDNPWLQLVNAVYLAFVFTQVSFIGHDLGHRQIFNSTRANDLAGLIFGNLLVGISRSWWIEKHNAHHSHPNQIDLDPDIDLMVIAFTEDQARNTRGPARWIVKYQAYFLFPLMTLLGIGWRAYSVQTIHGLLKNRAKYAVAEALLLVAHAVVYASLVFYALGGWMALLFVVVHQGLFGLYMGSVFAPNHKGMPVLDKDSQLDFLRQQVVTARNVRSHVLTNFWYGALNFQIEHHLFPSMPANSMSKAHRIVRDFCEARAVPYYETSVLQSYWEILQFLHALSAPLRTQRA